MGRELFVVSRDRPDLYRYLTETFAGAESVEVIWDRRSWTPGPSSLPSGAERRTRHTVDADLRLVGYAFVVLD
jgi:hypothetical protein